MKKPSPFPPLRKTLLPLPGGRWLLAAVIIIFVQLAFGFIAWIFGNPFPLRDPVPRYLFLFAGLVLFRLLAAPLARITKPGWSRPVTGGFLLLEVIEIACRIGLRDEMAADPAAPGKTAFAWLFGIGISVSTAAIVCLLAGFRAAAAVDREPLAAPPCPP